MNTWQSKVIGLALPESIKNIAWHESDGDSQAYGDDMYGNEWVREDGTYRVTLQSEYREAVFIPVFVNVDKSFSVTDLEIEAYVSYGPSHGRPGYLDPQKREINQVGRLIKLLFGIK
ncbi:hypothetical protein [Humidesulfovibrio mexicanus]|uniref:hypothetical protein n=1 Tax=Humidesulfovibrio mexicanus TaxID=147047 RepID=UPI0011782858|nr:hypothetical protein [Humidesulfovibrio mexicanus]